jgi:putative addiction module CopG family antidote
MTHYRLGIWQGSALPDMNLTRYGVTKAKVCKAISLKMSVDKSKSQAYFLILNRSGGPVVKNISISLTDQHAAEIEAVIATGDYASVSEVIRSALRDFLNAPVGPSLRQMEQDFLAYRARVDTGEQEFVPGEAAFADVITKVRA